MSERNKTEIELHDIPASVMSVLLDFVYTETVDVSVENVQELLPAACLLQLKGVKQACSEFLQKQLDSTNCLGIRIFAENHSCRDLKDAAEVFCYKHFEEVVHQEEFLTLQASELETLIKSNEIQVMFKTFVSKYSG
jgi:kelch-like protein 12